MNTDKLYDYAFQFKKTKLWKKLYDTQLFAIEHADGEIGYCCVMGMAGEHLALAVYPGSEGFDSYRLMGKNYLGMDELEAREAALAQNCVMCSFGSKDDLRPRELQEAQAYCGAHHITLRGKNAYPQFERFKPHYLPWFVDDEADQMHLIEALEACMEVSSRLESASPEALGFTEVPHGPTMPFLKKHDGRFVWDMIPLPEPLPAVYASPEVHDDIQLARIKKSRKRSGEWACDVIMHPQPASNEEGEDHFIEELKSAPFFPYVLLIVDNKSGMLLGTQLALCPDEYATDFARAILETAETKGKPTRILVRNERTHALFIHLAKQLGAELRMQTDIPLLEEIEQDFLEHFDGDDAFGDDMMEMIQMLSDAETLADIPDEFLIELAKIIEVGVLPDKLIANVVKECKKRGL